MEHDHDRPLPEGTGGRHNEAAMDFERSPYPHPDRELTPGELANAATARRLEREEAFVNTGQVAGHDFVREERERERGR